MIAINADPKVMEFFPGIPTVDQTITFIHKMQKQFEKNGFCYFAVDKLDDGEFIGFIGLAEQTFEAEFTPCIDIGWRIKQQYWGKGYAREGAKKCFDFAFNDLKIKTIKSIAPEINLKSVHMMQKIGMRKVSTFNHPLLKDHEHLKTCVLYELKK